MTDVLVIDRRDALEDFVREAVRVSRIGVDTEFVRDRHYFPRAGLIQIAAGDLTGLVDPVALDDLEPLEALLFDPDVEKILHAGRQDLELFVQLFDRVPAPLFDTQVAAAMLELADQIGYAALAEELLQEPPGPALGRYDWLRRPLAAEAIRYAAEDVAHLAAMRDILGSRLEQAHKAGTFAGAMRDAVEADYYRPRPDNAWRRVRQSRRMNGDSLSRLKRLAEWRERQAMHEDRPRQWLVRDGALATIARRAPSSLAEMAEVRDLPAGARRRYGPAMLTAMAGGEETG